MKEDKEKARILKDSLSIIDKLAELDVDDKYDIEDIYDLIKRAIVIKKNPYWKLK